MLSQRYDAYEANVVLSNFADATELKMILNNGRKKIKDDIKQLEKTLDKYGAILPSKPSEYATYTDAVEMFTDKFIFRQIFMGIQGAINIYFKGIIASVDPVVRDLLRKQMNLELDLLDNLFEYGKLKNYTDAFPRFRN